MAFCTKCGAKMADQVTTCPQCGAAHAPAGGTPPQPSGSGGGMPENTAAALAYSLGWLTGIIFFLIDKRPYVRFHAAQSIVTFGALHVFRSILAVLFGVGFFANGWRVVGPGIMVLHLISLISFILWIVLMIKAYQGERFKVPVASEIAEGLAGK